MRSENRIIWILLALLFTVPSSILNLGAQSVIFDLPDNLVVCQDDDLQLLVRNTGSNILSNAELELSLPCGLEYIPGTVQGAFIKNDDDPVNPVFTLPDLAPDENLNVKFKLTAPCISIDCIDSGALFRIIARLQTNQGETEFQSSYFVVETPQAVITRIDSPIMNGEKGDVLTRKIYIRNSRPGFIDTLVFSDVYTIGLSIQSDIGAQLATGPGMFEVMLTGNDFRKFGDGDDLFEFNEELCLTETIFIDACGFDYSSIRSDLDVQWGCNNMVCPSPFPAQTALINLSFSVVEGPILEFIPEANSPCCYCGDISAAQSMIVRNTSEIHSASTISVTIDSENFPDSGFYNELVEMQTDTGLVFLDPVFFAANNSVCTDMHRTFYIIIPSLDPGEEVSLHWNAYFCNREPCLADPYEWDYRTGYRKECTINDDDYHKDSDISQPSEYVLLRTGYGPAPSFEYLQEETLRLEVFSPFLTEKTGTLDIELKVSCQLDVLEQEWNLNGVSPISVSSESFDDETVYQLSYQLPLSFNLGEIFYDVQCLCTDQCGPEFCQEEFVSSCSSPCEGEVFLFDISTVTTLNFDECNGECLIEYCDFQVFYYDCDLPVCETVVEGYLLADFDMYRLNTGLPDNDNDHFPDQAGTLNYDSIRLDRAITGDTLRVVVNAEVIIDVPGASFENALIDLSTKLLDTEGMDPLFQFNEYSRFFDPNHGLINFQSELIIVDASSGRRYVCTEIPRFDLDSTGIKSFDLSLEKLRENGCAIPIDYRYASGDSIYLTADFFINYNIQSLLLNFGKIYFEVLNTNALYNGSLEGIDPFTCQCNIRNLEVANFKAVVTSNGMAVDCCYGDGEGFSKIVKVGTFSDYFPYEYKPPLTLDALLMPRVEGITLTEATIVSAFSNGEQVLDLLDTINHISLDFTEQDSDTIVFDLAESQTGFYILHPQDELNLPWDENQEFRIFFKYRNEGCVFIGTQDYFGLKEISYSPGIGNLTFIPGPSHQVILVGKQILPDLTINLCEVTSFSDILEWELQLSYDMLFDANLESIIQNNWIRPSSLSGNLSLFEVSNIETGESYNQTGEVFQLGEMMKGDTLNLLLKALSSSCETEMISIEYGWNCEPYLMQDQFVCFKDTIICSGISPPGVIDMIADTSDLSAILCDTFPKIEIEIFNAGLGSLAELLLEVQLPPGLTIVPNTTLIEYPSSSMNIFSIGDPDISSNSELLWNISSYFSGAENSLPGVNAFPENSFTLSFHVASDCDFISGSRIIYTAGGIQLCDINSNTVSKISGPLSIIDTDPSYKATIDLDSEINGCKDEMDIKLKITTSQNTMIQDELAIQLPEGLFYIAGSCTSIHGNCEPITDGNLLSWILPTGFMNMEFNLKLGGIDSFECGSFHLPVYTTTRTNVLCAEDSSACSIKLATGESIEQLFIERPVFGIESISLNAYNLQEMRADLSVTISNNSVANKDSIVLSLYTDEDRSGNLTSGDIFVGDYLFDRTIDEGQLTDLFLALDGFDLSRLCDLLVVIDEKKNCICNRTEQLWSGEIVLEAFQIFEMCSGDTLTIGIDEESGTNYQWTSPVDLSCSGCSRTSVSLINDGFEVMSYNFILEELSESTCKIHYEFIVEVHPEPRIWSRDHKVCHGEELTLLASDAVSYTWDGPGIINPESQSQVLIPDSSALYTVTITDGFNCMAVDSAFITVLPVPVANAGTDQLVCYGQEVCIEAQDTSDSYTYTWIPGFPFLEDPGNYKTNVVISQDQDYILSVFDGACSNTDTTSIRFFDGLDFNTQDEFTICKGDPVMIALTDSLVYTWDPFFSDMCLDPDCSEVLFYPGTSLTMTIVGQSEEQCLDTNVIQIIVLNEIDTEIVQMGICPGDSVEWQGIHYTSEGIYCDTLLSPEGCDYLSCLELLIYDLTEVEITAENTTINAGGSVQLTASSGFETYNWEYTPSLNCLDCRDPVATIDEDELFILTAIDMNGCAQTDSIHIRTLTPCSLDEVLIPNAFTPNDNSKNDRFRLANQNTESWNIQIEIYDRWGERLFEGFDNNGWDGRYRDVDAREGVYLYIIRVDCGDGDEELFKGNVTLIR